MAEDCPLPLLQCSRTMQRGSEQCSTLHWGAAMHLSAQCSVVYHYPMQCTVQKCKRGQDRKAGAVQEEEGGGQRESVPGEWQGEVMEGNIVSCPLALSWPVSHLLSCPHPPMSHFPFRMSRWPPSTVLFPIFQASPPLQCPIFLFPSHSTHPHHRRVRSHKLFRGYT